MVETYSHIVYQQCESGFQNKVDPESWQFGPDNCNIPLCVYLITPPILFLTISLSPVCRKFVVADTAATARKHTRTALRHLRLDISCPVKVVYEKLLWLHEP